MSELLVKPYVFVLMPFSDEFMDIYKLGIKETCTKLGAFAERVDEQIFKETILEHILIQISKADLIIADMTGRNPNVFYEVGFAHALKRPVVLLTQDSDDIPFDLKQHRHIVYGKSIKTLREQLEDHLKWHLDNPSKPPEDIMEGIEYYMQKQPLKAGVLINSDPPHHSINKPPRWSMDIGVHNIANRVLDLRDVSFALILPEAMEIYESTHTVIPGGKIQIRGAGPDRILPEDWGTIKFDIEGHPSLLTMTTPIAYSCELRIYSADGSRVLPFTFFISNRKG